MKSSLIIVGCFVAGVLANAFGLLPEWLVTDKLSSWMLYLLLFCIGLELGMDENFFKSFKLSELRYLFLPLITIIGTFVGCAAAFAVLGVMGRNQIGFMDTIAVGSGYGYYSLSSIMLDKARGAQIATIALASNLMREILTLLLSPLIARLFGPYAVVSCGGATSMDTTMGVAVRAGGSRLAPAALYHGFVLTVAVPFIITLILSLY